ncbi:hypothetical protein [Actinomadura sp. NTSP31]|uniref:hypothetical protein n=1 Tax=Actinomadura sp. NTSP31 TaxID=1735447 RepID=UPI0035C11C24
MLSAVGSVGLPDSEASAPVRIVPALTPTARSGRSIWPKVGGEDPGLVDAGEQSFVVTGSVQIVAMPGSPRRHRSRSPPERRLQITKGSEWGWTSGTTLGLFIAAAVVLVLWAGMELHLKALLVNLRATARPAVLCTNLASITVDISFLAASLILPPLLELPKATGGLGQSMVVAAFSLQRSA